MNINTYIKELFIYVSFTILLFMKFTILVIRIIEVNECLFFIKYYCLYYFGLFILFVRNERRISG